jgi:hypothetical protein
MKTRQGFVSNSSSSSFVIAKAYMTEEQVAGLRGGLTSIKKNNGEMWGESGRTWEETSHYFCIENYYIYEQINDLFKSLNLGNVPTYNMEG